MAFAIKVSTRVVEVPSRLQSETDGRFISLILVSIIKRRFKRPDIVKQIVLTKLEEEAEKFDTLEAAQKMDYELRVINSNYKYTIIEIV